MARPCLKVECTYCKSWRAQCTDDTEAEVQAFLLKRVNEHVRLVHPTWPEITAPVWS